ncbi:hypothetical protein BH11BAC5_BH11BAC5_50900 [soil metagenome]
MAYISASGVLRYALSLLMKIRYYSNKFSAAGYEFYDSKVVVSVNKKTDSIIAFTL